jgi:hypothetical protein
VQETRCICFSRRRRPIPAAFIICVPPITGELQQSFSRDAAPIEFFSLSFPVRQGIWRANFRALPRAGLVELLLKFAVAVVVGADPLPLELPALTQ